MFGGNLRQILFAMGVLIALIDAIRADDDGGDDMKVTVDDAIEMMDSFAKNCKPEPTRDEMRAVVLNKDPVDKGTMCFRYCILKQLEMMEDSDKTHIVMENALSMLSMVYPDKEDDMKQLVSECNAANKMITDGCEAAHKHAICLVDKLKAKGYKLPEFEE